jgi:hypothetical protein
MALPKWNYIIGQLGLNYPEKSRNSYFSAFKSPFLTNKEDNLLWL